MDKSVLRKSPLKVLLAIRQGQVGGGESHVLELVQGFKRSAVIPVVLSFTPGEMMDRLMQLGVEAHVIETTRPFDIRVWGEVKELFKKINADIIHAHGTRAASNTFWAARSLKLPFLYTIHGWSFHQGQRPLIYKLRLRMEAYLTRKADLNICVSQNNQREGEELFGFKNSMVIHNGVNQTKFNPEGTFPDIRHEYSIARETVLIGFISRITYQKNTLNFIRAIQVVAQKVDNFKVLIVGDGDEKEAAVRLAAELNLQSKIQFVNFRKDVPAILKAIDIYCLPSWWEGFSIGLIEAMAMRKCVVCSNIGGNNEIIQSKQNGYFCDPSDIQSIADPLIHLCQHPDERIRVARNAYETVSSIFSADVMVRKVEETYTAVLAKS